MRHSDCFQANSLSFCVLFFPQLKAMQDQMKKLVDESSKKRKKKKEKKPAGPVVGAAAGKKGDDKTKAHHHELLPDTKPVAQPGFPTSTPKPAKGAKGKATRGAAAAAAAAAGPQPGKITDIVTSEFPLNYS